MSAPRSPIAGFAPTRWSLVARARGTTPEARAALSELCEAYWRPVFETLRRWHGTDDEAREWAQEFFAHVLAGGRIIKSGDKSLALELEARGYDWVLETVA
jgi:hypothetical protein